DPPSSRLMFQRVSALERGPRGATICVGEQHRLVLDHLELTQEVAAHAEQHVRSAETLAENPRATLNGGAQRGEHLIPASPAVTHGVGFEPAELLAHRRLD